MTTFEIQGPDGQTFNVESEARGCTEARRCDNTEQRARYFALIGASA